MMDRKQREFVIQRGKENRVGGEYTNDEYTRGGGFKSEKYEIDRQKERESSVENAKKNKTKG